MWNQATNMPKKEHHIVAMHVTKLPTHPTPPSPLYMKVYEADAPLKSEGFLLLLWALEQTASDRVLVLQVSM